ncbi:MAG: TonB family protein [Ignavibacteriaceae bacterium]
MDKNIITDLIKLEVLNFSDKENAEALQFLKRDDESFPWKELGEYQNLIAILSVSPIVSNPPENLKNELIKKACKLKGLAEPIEQPDSIVPKNETVKQIYSQKNIPEKQEATLENIPSDKEYFVSQQETYDEKPNEEMKITNKNNGDKTEAKAIFGKDFILSKVSNPSGLPDTSDEKPSKDTEAKRELKNKITSSNKEKVNVINELKKGEEKAADFLKDLNSFENDQLIEKETNSRNKNFETKNNRPGTNNKSLKQNRISNLVIVVILIVLAIPFILFLSSSKEESNQTTGKSEKVEDLIEKVKSSKPESIVNTGSAEKIKEVKLDKEPLSTKAVNNVQPAPLPEPKLIEPEIDITKDIPDKNTEPEMKISLEEKIAEQPKERKIIEEEPQFFVAVEDMPEPIGGIQAIQKKIKYPDMAKKAGVAGKVFVTAFVDETGTVTNLKLLKGLGAGCDEEAINAVKETKFKPGMQRGRPVKVQITIPIVFKLHE